MGISNCKDIILHPHRIDNNLVKHFLSYLLSITIFSVGSNVP
jgi:hypothetical protein